MSDLTPTEPWADRARTAVGASAAKLRVEGISKTFVVPGGARSTSQRLQVLDAVTFDVPDHQIVSIIGESGCGKTTLLRIIQGLVRPDSGKVVVDDIAVTGPGYDRGIVFQQANLLPWRSAQKNVEFGLELKGISRADRTARARELLALVGLAGAERRFPHQLSGGMQQRVGLARAIAIDPEILLMDEPFSALDAQTRELLQTEFLRIYRVTRKTVLFVTHDLDEALYLSDRVIVMSAHPGRVKEVVSVPFGRPRPDLTSLKANPEFLGLRSRIWSSIGPGEDKQMGPSE